MYLHSYLSLNSKAVTGALHSDIRYFVINMEDREGSELSETFSSMTTAHGHKYKSMRVKLFGMNLA